MAAPQLRRRGTDLLFPAAVEALLELVRHDAVAHPSPRLRDLLANEPTRSALQALAARHGVLGAVLIGLQAAARRDSVLASHCESLLAQLPLSRKHATMWDLETGRLLRLLDDAGLRPITLKGAALRASTYRDTAQRTFGDVDLLLPPAEIDGAIAALQAAGYAIGDAATVARFAEQHFHHRLINAMGFQVELHWGLVRPDSVIRLSPERIRSRSVTLKLLDGTAMRIPSSEDMVLHLASQETEDWFSTIRRLVDIDRVVRSTASFDWTYLRSAAAESRMGPVLGFTLQLCRRLLSTPIPAGIIPGLGISRSARFHLALLDPVTCVLTGYAQRRAAAARVLALSLTPDRRSRWRVLREVATSRFDSFAVDDLEGSSPSVTRGMVSLAKLGAFWVGLYLRRGVAVILQSTLKHRDFWADAL
jgi:hypothetical protein